MDMHYYCSGLPARRTLDDPIPSRVILYQLAKGSTSARRMDARSCCTPVPNGDCSCRSPCFSLRFPRQQPAMLYPFAFHAHTRCPISCSRRLLQVNLGKITDT